VANLMVEIDYPHADTSTPGSPGVARALEAGATRTKDWGRFLDFQDHRVGFGQAGGVTLTSTHGTTTKRGVRDGCGSNASPSPTTD
jgi:hypothetical protein